MNEPGKDRGQLTDKESLVDEVKTKLSEVLRKDGKEATLADSGPLLYVQYRLEPPNSIGDMQISPKSKDIDASLVLHQEINSEGPFGRLIALLKIIEDESESSSYTFIFSEGATPSFQYNELAPNKRFFSKQASEGELADFLQLLNRPLYLIASPR